MAVLDVAIPIVFPDYKIMVATPPTRVDLPGKRFDFTIPGTKNKLPYLGHAGILFLSGQTGTTKYFEYGRYDPAAKGLVRRQPLLDTKLVGGKPTSQSLAKVLGQLSSHSGQGGRIEGAYIELAGGAFTKMLDYCVKRMAKNGDPKRAVYDLDDHSCLHFMRDVALAGGAAMPEVFDPRPVGYVERVRDTFPDLDYTAPGKLAVQGIALP